MPTIPASAIVSVSPNVIGAGGSALDLVGLVLTNSTRAPIGSIVRFSSALDVSAYFGPLSTEASLATVYFNGYEGASITPASMLFAQYPSAAVAAYVRGNDARSLTLQQLQAISGTMTLTIDGRNVTTSNVSLAGATSFSAAAALIQTALADQAATVTGSITGTTLTVSSGTGLAPGQTVEGANVLPGTLIVSGSGTSWVVSTAQTVASTTLTIGRTTVSFDSVGGAFVITAGTPGAAGNITYPAGSLANALFLTQTTGAVASQGAAAATPGPAMDGVVALTQDFVSFCTTFKPTANDMLAFAAWTDAQNDRYLYAMWDNDAAPTTNNDTSSVGFRINALGYTGTALLYAPSNGAALAASLMGWVASIDFDRVEGRVTLAFRSATGLTAGVTNQTIATNLAANGYNFYGAYATANNPFTFFYPGQVSGKFDWLDSYVNQIWLNNGFQLALMTLLTQIGSIPYNNDGYSLIETALTDQIQAGVDFGAIRAGVPLTALQAAQINSAAGRIVNDTMFQRGWYLAVEPASPQVRAARGSPPCTFFYMDGQSIQKITLSSVLVQ